MNDNTKTKQDVIDMLLKKIYSEVISKNTNSIRLDSLVRAYDTLTMSL